MEEFRSVLLNIAMSAIPPIDVDNYGLYMSRNSELREELALFLEEIVERGETIPIDVLFMGVVGSLSLAVAITHIPVLEEYLNTLIQEIDVDPDIAQRYVLDIIEQRLDSSSSEDEDDVIWFAPRRTRNPAYRTPPRQN
jgi:hypothetical protein